MNTCQHYRLRIVLTKMYSLIHVPNTRAAKKHSRVIENPTMLPLHVLVKHLQS